MTDWDKIKTKVLNGDVLAFYSTSEWRKKREQIKQRDHYLCQRCLGKYQPKDCTAFSRAQIVHHIVPLRQDFSLRLTDSNLISLCFQCHEEVEGRAHFENINSKKLVTEERW